MKRMTFLAIVAGLFFLNCCAVKNYPREVTLKEKIDTNIAWTVDTATARYISSYYKPLFGMDEQLARVDYTYYLDPAFRKDPRLFYPSPESPPEFEFMEKFEEKSGVEFFFTKWPSVYTPANPDYIPLYESYPETHSAYAIYARSKVPNRAAIIISHGWVSPDIRKEYKNRHMDEFAAMGFDSVFLQQPYHGIRQPADSAFSGELFISGEVSRINEAFRQSITDLRTMLLWLRERYEVVGIQGGSLGGITTLLAACVEDDIDFAVAWVPPYDVGAIPFDSALAHFIARGMKDSGLDKKDVENILYVSNPVNMRPAISKDKILIIAGMGDNFVPPNHPETIWLAWDKPEIFWFAGGHALNFQEELSHEKEAEFIKAWLPR